MIASGLARPVKIALRLAGLAPAFVLGIPAQWVAMKLGATGACRWMPVYFHRYLLAVLGVRVEHTGKIAPDRPLLIVANHLSWLDIVVISSLAPVSFIAKSEVAGWPGFGTLARLQRSVFVERQKRGKTADANASIADRLTAGDAMVLFGEGTTSDGMRVLPFRSAIIGAAQAASAGAAASSYVQPLAIGYPEIGRLPVSRADMPFIAWHGDMELVPHLSDLLTLPGITARVVLGDAEAVDTKTDRKTLTRRLEAMIRAELAAIRTGRRQEA